MNIDRFFVSQGEDSGITSFMQEQGMTSYNQLLTYFVKNVDQVCILYLLQINIYECECS